jgi:hypothetical protein
MVDFLGGLTVQGTLPIDTLMDLVAFRPAPLFMWTNQTYGPDSVHMN